MKKTRENYSQEVKRVSRDSFQTPAYAIDLLVPYIPFSVDVIIEPAAGLGYLANRLEYHGFSVHRYDVDPTLDKRNVSLDFLTAKYALDRDYAIITNPPYSKKREFYKKCLYFYRKYGTRSALLIPADYCQWVINAIRNDGMEKIIPYRRIDFITPTGKDGLTSTADFHSMWITLGFNLGQSETFVDLSLEDKKNIYG